MDGRVDLTRLKPIARCGYRGDYTVVESLFEMLRPDTTPETGPLVITGSSAVVSALMFVEAAGAVLVFGGLACVASAIAGRRSWLVAALFAAALGARRGRCLRGRLGVPRDRLRARLRGRVGDGARAARQAAADDVAGLRHGRVRGGGALGHDGGGAGGDAGRERRRRRAGPGALAGERGARVRAGGVDRARRACRGSRPFPLAVAVWVREPPATPSPEFNPVVLVGAAGVRDDGADAARRRAVRVAAARRRDAGHGHRADGHGAGRADDRRPAQALAPAGRHGRPDGARQPPASARARWRRRSRTARARSRCC